MKISRRRFLATTAAFSCSRDLLASARQSPTAEASARERLLPFEYSQVRLTGGPLAQQYDAVHAHYLSLSSDRLLKVYRQRAGLPASGKDMGGWYDRDGFVPGHSLGQYISGLARIGASTGDTACHAKVHDLVTGFAETLGQDNKSIIRPETNLWICYTLDKHFAGLLDASLLSNMPEARPLITRILDGARPLLPARGRDRIGKKDPPYDETFVMPENLFAAAQLTGNPAFEELGRRYLLDRELFDPLARGEDPLPGQHAYSHAIALSSAGKAYLHLGDSKYLQAMQHAFTLLTTQQQFASGGWGPNETFIYPHRGELYESLLATPDHFETPCGSYAATKLARYLMRTTPPTDTQHGDYLERVVFNTILSVRQPDSDGDYPYYSTYSPQAEKVYYKAKWPCCSGTLVQTVADYPQNLYFLRKNECVFVNFYASSEAKFTYFGVPVTLRQHTAYPAEDSVELTLEAPQELNIPLLLRIPAWTPGRATIAVNGKIVATPSAGTWARVQRRWRSGDRVVLTLPQDFRFESIDDKHPDVVALMRGPVQYVALNAPAGFPHLSAPSSLRRVSAEAFTEHTPEGDLVFVPLHRVTNETYTSYFTRA